MISAAMGTQRRLRDTTTFYLDSPHAATHMALEERLSHLRNDPRRPDYHSTDSDQLVDVLGVQVSHASHLFHSKRTNLHTIKPFSYVYINITTQSINQSTHNL